MMPRATLKVGGRVTLVMIADVRRWRKARVVEIVGKTAHVESRELRLRVSLDTGIEIGSAPTWKLSNSDRLRFVTGGSHTFGPRLPGSS